jgi:hypothetical protein
MGVCGAAESSEEGSGERRSSLEGADSLECSQAVEAFWPRR